MQPDPPRTVLTAAQIAVGVDTPGTYAHRMYLARTVTCPRCHAHIGQDCRRPAGNPTLHTAREQAAAQPSDTDAVRAIEEMLIALRKPKP